MADPCKNCYKLHLARCTFLGLRDEIRGKIILLPRKISRQEQEQEGGNFPATTFHLKPKMAVPCWVKPFQVGQKGRSFSFKLPSNPTLLARAQNPMVLLTPQGILLLSK
jgi:hypothetical protein